MKIYRTLPDNGCWKARFEAEFYCLKKNKRRLYESNRELHYTLRYLIFSRYARCWYERVVDERTLPDNIGYYTRAGALWLWPTEENKQRIREDVEKSGLSYNTLMLRRQNEIDLERLKKWGNRGDAWQYWQKYRKELINKLKNKKK